MLTLYELQIEHTAQNPKQCNREEAADKVQARLDYPLFLIMIS